LVDNGVTISNEPTDPADQLSGQARSLVWVASDGVTVGVIGIADPIKETTSSAIQRLHDMGVKVVMRQGIIHRQRKRSQSDWTLMRFTLA